jgi:hypothetical protein
VVGLLCEELADTLSEVGDGVLERLEFGVAHGFLPPFGS